MQDLLYGTYLTFRVKEVMDTAQTPLSVRQIATCLAAFDGREGYNLRRRIRKSLRMLEDRGDVVIQGWHRENNLMTFTYATKTNAHESDGQTPGTYRQDEA